MTIKQSIPRRLPVWLVDDTDFKTGKTGVAFGSATVKYAKEGDNSWSIFTLDITKWIELGDGVYDIVFGASELDTLGNFKYLVQVSGAVDYPGWVDIQANSNDDIKDAVDAISVENFNMGAK